MINHVDTQNLYFCRQKCSKIHLLIGNYLFTENKNIYTNERF